jgi:hypothetical protein
MGTSLVWAQAPAPAAANFTITLKDGKSVVTNNLRRSGDNLMAKVRGDNGTGEVGYPVSNVARVTFPEPAELKTAASLLTQNKPAEALTRLTPVLATAICFATWRGTGGRKRHC